jgi:hypothetical protein
MNLPDRQIMTYMELMLRNFQNINSTSRRAVLVNIRTYAVGIIRVVDFCLGRLDASLNIDELQAIEPENSSSITAQLLLNSSSIQAQKPEITAQKHINCSNVCECGCGRSLHRKRKGTKFFEKQCANSAR